MVVAKALPFLDVDLGEARLVLLDGDFIVPSGNVV